VITFVSILVAFGFVRLMKSTRVPALDPLRTRWRSLEPRIVDWIRHAPATYSYLFVLLVTTWMLETSSTSVARQLLLDRSTNLHELAHDPVRVIPASAFIVTSAPEWLAWVVLFTVLAAPVEHRIGSGQAIAVFALGHVGATLLTATGLRLALRFDLVESSVVRAVDVGPSYGFLALAGLMTYLLFRRFRRIYIGVLLLIVVTALVVVTSFTDFGHLAAVLIGLACRPFVPSRARGSLLDGKPVWR
jgi:Rhomboid-like protein